MKRSVMLIALIWGALWCAVATAQGPEAKQILEASGVQGGLVVQLGCGDGALTAALHASDSFTVQGLDADPKNVEAARRQIQSLGLYGPVSADRFDGKRLPYADNLVNLVVARDPAGVAQEEILRVLAPGGVACLMKNGQWEKTVKPWPKDIDQWTHFLHDAGNNAVAHDTRVDQPRTLQWVAPPLWLRSHETPSGFEAMVSGAGRLFYIFDEGVIGITDQRLPERWALICRDAFNGRQLWRREMGAWGWPEWAKDKFASTDWTTIGGGRTVVPDENHRRLVADGNRLYATLAYNAPLSILDAASGKTLVTVEGTAPARQILASDGVAVVYSAPIVQQAGAGKNAKAARQSAKAGAQKNVKADAQKNRKGRKQKKTEAAANPTDRTDPTDSGAGTLTAVQGETGKVLWRKPVGTIQGLSFACDQGRVVFLAGKKLNAVDLKTGKDLWQAEPEETAVRTMVVTGGAVVLLGGGAIEVRDAATGAQTWRKQIHLAAGMGGEDLFVVGGTIWPRIQNVAEDRQPGGKWKGSNALAIGYDLKTGAEAKTIFVPELLSPEHHHRCYRNKATDRFIITSMEGAEFIDLLGDGHGQNNFVRGACRLGMMPCNGMLYVPPDQCFCQPGGKVLGLTAIGPAPAQPLAPVADEARLERGPAYELQMTKDKGQINPGDWPTFRYDAARHGATPASVGAAPADAWTVKLGGGLTAPVAVGERVYVASREAHTLHALDAATGKAAWSFVAGGRIDSPPTIHEGRVLVGSADGWVYCLNAADGALAWRFLAAPCDRRIASFDQFESPWPVHGSVLVRDGVAYAGAGRSSYLDGGIRLWGLDPATGKILHKGTLEGPQPNLKDVPRDLAFFIRGANSDVLVSEGDAIYMRQKRLTPALQEQVITPLTNKGESDVGLHVFSTSGLLDSSWYNRAFWMYAKRWPGFQLANQAPKSGQALVVDEANTYAVSVFYRRNVHTTMFFPAKEGYLLFADKNTNEPQIVGDKDARKPVAWLPQSDFGASTGLRTLDSEAFGLDKGTGYTRAEPPLWTLWLPVRVRAMVKAGGTIYAAGPPDVLDPQDPFGAFEGRKGTKLVSVAAADGKKVGERALPADPVFDGLIAAGGRLFAALEDGSLVCLK